MSANQQGPPRESAGRFYHADSTLRADASTGGARLFHRKMNERRSSWNHPTETMRPPRPIGRRDPCTCPLCPPPALLKGEGDAAAEEAMGWLSCMKCLWGHAQAHNESPQKAQKNHNRTRRIFFSLHAVNKQTHGQTRIETKRKKKGRNRSKSALLRTGGTGGGVYVLLG